MGYSRYQPCSRLAPYVECIWVQEGPADGCPASRPTRILPTSKIDLIFYFGDPFVELVRGAEIRVPRFSLTGPWTRPFEVQATGRTGIVLVAFYPWGAYPFFGVPLRHTENDHLDLECLFRRSTLAPTADRILESQEPRDRVAAIEDYLVGRLDEDRRDPLVEDATRRIHRRAGRIQIPDLAKGLFMSRRHLSRRFRRSIGMPPKVLARVSRFQKGLGLLRRGLDWKTIVERCAYYDQAHFIKEIKAFSGYTPGQIPEAGPETNLMRYYNRPPERSHFYNTVYL